MVLQSTLKDEDNISSLTVVDKYAFFVAISDDQKIINTLKKYHNSLLSHQL